ncbi:hypothetical protein [Cupriavidus pampae]|jgi:hypothetical protein|uniref:Pilus assembly protein n=1 Tax=Cupriavidus pampae TaxID=659251 RepID=A0ABM8XTY2_9BURK|nr:hypothetical protein [Cupriavidus pampae]CAG9183832.1 hypothetical protein LMG32289_05435 [Cupriavidus pampae]
MSTQTNPERAPLDMRLVILLLIAPCVAVGVLFTGVAESIGRAIAVRAVADGQARDAASFCFAEDRAYSEGYLLETRDPDGRASTTYACRHNELRERMGWEIVPVGAFSLPPELPSAAATSPQLLPPAPGPVPTTPAAPVLGR